jgi:putative ABC transport system substrate-binding protein
MKRRDFITLLAGTVAAWPIAARAQQAGLPVVGWLASGSAGAFADIVAAFRKGLGEVGFVEGRNVVIEYRWAEGQYERLPAMAADLVRRRVAVIAAGGGPEAPIAKAATSTVPIVFVVGVDPVEVGLVASLNRPGGNLTGLTALGAGLGPKRLELLHELVPTASVLGALLNPTRTNFETESTEFEAAAGKLGLQLEVLRAADRHDLDMIFGTLAQEHIGGLVVTGDPFFNAQAEQLAALTGRYAVPAIFQDREFTAAGGLASYGAARTEIYRQSGLYVGRILKGERPADLPVMQPTKFELIINLKTAKALGITPSLPLLGRADEVIE